MTRLTRMIVVVAGVCMLFIAPAAMATPSLGLTTDFSVDEDGFAGTNSVPGFTVQQVGSGGNPDEFLRIRFPAGGGSQENLASNETANYTGSYQQRDLYVYFDFYASNSLPDSSALWFGSGGDIWRLAFTQTALGWERHYAIFDYDFGSGWTSELGGNETDFINALSSVDWIGIHVVDNAIDFGVEMYGIDNWGYAVPEPSDYAMAIVLLLAVWVMYRKRQQEPDSLSAMPAAA